jgi:hypothetical protein
MIYYLEKTVPLLIVGRQRAGTRHLTNVLDSFDDVLIQGEIPNQVMSSIEKMVSDTDKYYRNQFEKNPENELSIIRYENWKVQRQDLMLSLWANCSQQRRKEPGPLYKYFGIKDFFGFAIKTDNTSLPDRQDFSGRSYLFNSIYYKRFRIPKASYRYYGYKRPNNEKYFELYEKIFELRPPVYIYCVRNFHDNFLSIISRWPDRDIEKVAIEFLESMAQYHIMKNAAPYRVLLFNLDDFIAQGFTYLEREIINKLGLTMSNSQRDFLTKLPPSNATEEKFGLERRQSMTEKEREYYLSRPELVDEFKKLCISV